MLLDRLQNRIECIATPQKSLSYLSSVLFESNLSLYIRQSKIISANNNRFSLNSGDVVISAHSLLSIDMVVSISTVLSFDMYLHHLPGKDNSARSVGKLQRFGHGKKILD